MTPTLLKQWEGYKVQIAETVPDHDTPKDKGDPTEQFIVEVVTTNAIASDLAGMQQVLSEEARQHGDRPSELYVDGAYVTDDTLAQAKTEGRELFGPARPCGNAPGNGFSADAFMVDTANRTAVCPAGHMSRQCSLIHDQYNRSVFLRFEWAGLCDECPLQKQCTHSRTGRRLLVVGVHHDLLQERRQQMQTESFKKIMRRRNGIEGTISEFTRGGGRRTRYRGRRKTALANYMQAAAVNANRWIRLLAWQHGRNRSSGPLPAALAVGRISISGLLASFASSRFDWGAGDVLAIILSINRLRPGGLGTF